MAAFCKVLFGAFARVSPALSPRAAAATTRCTSTEIAPGFQHPPKRPPNAYVLFVKEKLPESHEDYPELSYRDLMRHIGSLWTDMSDSDKQRYRELHAEQLEQWDVEFQTFMDTVPDKDEYLKQLRAIRGERREHLRSFRERKRSKHTKPPRKLSAYNIYVRDQLAGVSKDEIKTRFSEAAQGWKMLSKDEKTEFEQEARQIYEHEMEEFSSRVPPEYTA